MLDLHKLQIFLTVAEAGSLSAGAQRLRMTQSGVSQHIQALENGLGTALFQRGRHGVTLTQAGTALLPYARQLMTLAAEAENAVAIAETMRAGSVSIGATPGVGVYLLPKWLQTFRTRYPQIRVTVSTMTTPQVITALRDGSLDLGVIEGEIEDDTGLDLRVLEDVEQFVVVGQGHPWWGETEIPLDSLDGRPVVLRQTASQSRRWLDSLLIRHGVAPVVTAEFDNVESIKQTIKGGGCVAILPAYTVAQEQDAGTLRLITLEGHPLRRTLKLGWLKRERMLSPATKAFMREVSRIYPGVNLTV